MRLPGHLAARVAPALVCHIGSCTGTDPDALVDHLLDVVLVDLVEECDPCIFGRGQDARARVGQHLGHSGTRHVQGHAHVTGAPLGKPDARHRGTGFGVFQGMAVFDLEAYQQLTVGV